MATSRIAAYTVAVDLTRAGHTNSIRRDAWTPGFRAIQASPRTVRIWHDGPDEDAHLARYAATLRARGYYATPERATKTKRPTLRVTHP